MEDALCNQITLTFGECQYILVYSCVTPVTYLYIIAVAIMQGLMENMASTFAILKSI